jgi:hypothetical protein
LFSREDVSSHLNQNFEPAWEMVREVPIVRIDFGNGRIVTRTLHGNVASYICTAAGQVADILPGIYTPAAFRTALLTPQTLATAMNRLDAGPRLTRFRDYHREKAQALRAAARDASRPLDLIRDVGKGRIERPIERIVVVQPEATAPRPRNAAELATWQPLVADTQVNERQRRQQIHDRLATSELIRPEQVKTWLYRDVLHADLDDPNLGLGDDFFASFER